MSCDRLPQHLPKKVTLVASRDDELRPGDASSTRRMRFTLHHVTMRCDRVPRHLPKKVIHVQPVAMRCDGLMLQFTATCEQPATICTADSANT